MHDLALPAGGLRFTDYRGQFDECCAHADECQRLADRYPTVKQQYEVLAHQWRELSTHGERCGA